MYLTPVGQFLSISKKNKASFNRKCKALFKNIKVPHFSPRFSYFLEMKKLCLGGLDLF